MSKLTYKGSIKHKQWRPRGGFGTICPEWTHSVPDRGFDGGDEAYPWEATTAQTLLTDSYPVGSKRYAAARGVAFCAHESADGTWHGFPTPWKDVPAAATEWLIEAGKVTKREIRRQLRTRPQGLHWALDSDEP